MASLTTHLSFRLMALFSTSTQLKYFVNVFVELQALVLYMYSDEFFDSVVVKL